MQRAASTTPSSTTSSCSSHGTLHTTLTLAGVACPGGLLRSKAVGGAAGIHSAALLAGDAGLGAACHSDGAPIGLPLALAYTCMTSRACMRQWVRLGLGQRFGLSANRAAPALQVMTRPDHRHDHDDDDDVMLSQGATDAATMSAPPAGVKQRACFCEPGQLLIMALRATTGQAAAIMKLVKTPTAPCCSPVLGPAGHMKARATRQANAVSEQVRQEKQVCKASGTGVQLPCKRDLSTTHKRPCRPCLVRQPPAGPNAQPAIAEATAPVKPGTKLCIKAVVPPPFDTLPCSTPCYSQTLA